MKLILALEILFLVSPCLSSEKPLHLQFVELEKIRHLHDIVGARAQAKSKLLNLLRTNQTDIFQAQSLFLLAKMYDGEGVPDSAIVNYQRSLRKPGLTTAQLQWTYRRLATMNPKLVRAVTLQSGFEFREVTLYDHGGHATLLAEPKEGIFQDSRRRFFQLNSKGELIPLHFGLQNEERVIDISPRWVIVNMGSKTRMIDRTSPNGKSKNIELQTQQGFILNDTIFSYLLLDGKSIGYYEKQNLLYSFPYQGGNCSWNFLEKSTSRGLLHCRDSVLFLFEISAGQLTPLQNLLGKTYQVTSKGLHTLIQYENNFEIRKSSEIQTTLWHGSSSLFDKLYLTASQVYLIDSRGILKVFNLTNGQLLWEKDIHAVSLLQTQKEIVALKHAHSALGLDLQGNPLWEFEYGWNEEPLVYAGEDHLQLFYPSGKRLQLHLDLLPISQASQRERFEKLLGEKKTDWISGLKDVNAALAYEPGNGWLWFFKYMGLRKLSEPLQEQFQALTQVARSNFVPPQQKSEALFQLAEYSKAKWIWKMAYGPPHFPNMSAQADRLIYLESNNQTLVLLDGKTGNLFKSLHIPEALDSKLLAWTQDMILLSSPGKLFFAPTAKGSASTRTHTLTNPLCDALIIGNELYFSDWFGNLTRIDFSQDRGVVVRWTVRLSNNGLLLSHGSSRGEIAVAGFQGDYYSIAAAKGSLKYSLALKTGTITETYRQQTNLFMGYDNGQLVAVDMASQKVRWTVDLADQIFSLGGDGSDKLVVTTASKSIFTLSTRSGKVLWESTVPTSLINLPVVTKTGYWLGTSESFLERRDFKHRVQQKHLLTDIPGNPVLAGNHLFVSTRDGFVFAFEN